MSKNVLIVGSGGREHALAWKTTKSPHLGKLYVAPGNAGTESLAENVPIGITEIEKLAHFAEEHQIDLTIVGPDDSLASGIVDLFQRKGLRIFGPTQRAARIETSKSFAKKLMQEAEIPTASCYTFQQYREALAYIRKCDTPVVVKADGLALGKGVYICKTIKEAENALHKIMVDRIHGGAGWAVVVEEFLKGQEISLHAFSDGKTAVMFPTAQDHKPIRDGNEGPNTGGMGTYAPVPWTTTEFLDQAKAQIIEPVLSALTDCGSPFVGCLYPGLMITEDGPKVLEFNARFGDPETQTYMRLLKTDLIEIAEACLDGKLATLPIEWYSGFAACVVIASDGYPGKYKKGVPIDGLEKAEGVPDVVIFHAGTVQQNDQIKTSGGRVLGVTATGKTLRSALDRVYEAVQLIHFEGMQYRTDIGAASLNR